MTVSLTSVLAQAQDLPVSVKAVIACGPKVLLLRQPDGQWELPGGKVEATESLMDCLMRELDEETGLHVHVHRLLDTWVREKTDGRRRFIITFFCTAEVAPLVESVRLSPEHDGARFIRPEEAACVPMLEGYRRALQLAAEHLEGAEGR